MQEEPSYSKKKNSIKNAPYKTERSIAVAGIVLLIIRITEHFIEFKTGNYSNSFPVFISGQILNVTSIIIFTIILIRPQKLILYTIFSFAYVVHIIFDSNTSNAMDMLMMFMGMTALKRLGFFKNKGTLKNILLWAAYFTLRLYGLRFGIAAFINGFIYHWGVFVLYLILLHIMERPTRIIEVEKPIIIPIEEKPVLDLSQFTTFTDRDKEWIKRVMDGEKYQSIANDYKVTLGTVKNRMKLLYEEMHIIDRVTLLAQYGGQQIIFTEEERRVYIDNRERERRIAIDTYAKDHPLPPIQGLDDIPPKDSEPNQQ